MRTIPSFLFAGPFFFIAGLVGLKLADPRLYWRIAAKEDSPVESLTAIAFATAAALCVGLWVAFRRNGKRSAARLAALGALGFLLIGLEEISWGQRIFGWQSSGVFADFNKQAETNLHNFAAGGVLHSSFIVVGLYGTLAFLFVPAVASRLLSKKHDCISVLVTPPWYLASYFFPVALIYSYYEFLSPLLVSAWGDEWGWESGKGAVRFMIAKDQEPIEFILSLGFLLHIASVYQRCGWERCRPWKRTGGAG